MAIVRFTGKIEIIGINPYVLVSAEQANALRAGWKKPMPVLVQVNGVPNPPWKINIMPVGDGNFYLYLHGDVRKESNTKVGDIVTVDVSFDSSYKGGPMQMPEWFSKALADNELAKQNYDALPPSRQKEIVRYLSRLKSTAAIEKNLEKVMSILSGTSGRFMGRDWKEGK